MSVTVHRDQNKHFILQIFVINNGKRLLAWWVNNKIWAENKIRLAVIKHKFLCWESPHPRSTGLTKLYANICQHRLYALCYLGIFVRQRWSCMSTSEKFYLFSSCSRCSERLTSAQWAEPPRAPFLWWECLPQHQSSWVRLLLWIALWGSLSLVLVYSEIIFARLNLAFVSEFLHFSLMVSSSSWYQDKAEPNQLLEC